MILTCPSCTMRYLVSEGAVGPLGRQVKCAHCGNQWFQDGEEGLDEALYDDPITNKPVPVIDMVDVPEIDASEALLEQRLAGFQSILQKEIDAAAVVDEIPHGVRPLENDELVIPPPKTKKSIRIPKADARTGGFLAAGAVFLSILCVILALQPQISRAWPASNLLYGFFGMLPSVPGEGLTLNNLQAKFENGQVLMKGDITNPGLETIKVPSVLVSFTDKHDEVIGVVLIAPPAKSVEPGEKVSFDVVHTVSDNAVDATFAFSYMRAEATNVVEETPAPEAEVQEPAVEQEPTSEAVPETAPEIVPELQEPETHAPEISEPHNEEPATNSAPVHSEE